MTSSVVVVIAIDSSPQAEVAFDWYLEHIHRPGNTLVAVHCVDLDAITEQDDHAGGEDSRRWDQQKTKIRTLEDKFRWKLNDNGLPGKIRTESGKPGEAIVGAAVQEKAGLIVLGSRGIGKLKRTFTASSVSDYVLHHAKCPVVVCRQTEQAERRQSNVST